MSDQKKSGTSGSGRSTSNNNSQTSSPGAAKRSDGQKGKGVTGASAAATGKPTQDKTGSGSMSEGGVSKGMEGNSDRTQQRNSEKQKMSATFSVNKPAEETTERGTQSLNDPKQARKMKNENPSGGDNALDPNALKQDKSKQDATKAWQSQDGKDCTNEEEQGKESTDTTGITAQNEPNGENTDTKKPGIGDLEQDKELAIQTMQKQEEDLAAARKRIGDLEQDKELAIQTMQKQEEYLAAARKRIGDLEQDKKLATQTMQKQEEDLAAARKSIAVYDKEFERGMEQFRTKEKEIARYKEELGNLEGTVQYFKAELQKSGKDNKALQKELQGKSRELADLHTEFNDLKTRFGKMAGEKMKHDNPDIVNLGDQNRSTKIAEKFGALYNDAWTDAWSAQMDDLNYTEEQATKNLLDILKTCYVYCMEKAESQFSQLSIVLTDPIQSVEGFKKPTKLKIPATTGTTLKEIRKDISVGAADQIKTAYLEMCGKDSDKKLIAATKPYIEQCVELCWVMVLNLPPLYMEFEVKPDDKIDTNLYTKRSPGGKIKALVWPALFNGKGGGLLQKGVVEAVAEKKVMKKGK